jgi:hypothetical protein
MNTTIHAIFLGIGIGVFYYSINHAPDWVTYTTVYGLFGISVLVDLICIGIWFVSREGGFTIEEKKAIKNSPTVSFLTLDALSVASIAYILYTNDYIYTCFLLISAFCFLLSLLIKYYWCPPKSNTILDKTTSEIILEEWGNCNFKKVATILDQLNRRQTADAIYLISKIYGLNDGRIASKLVCD